MKLVLVAHNVRSAHNVGSLLRTAEGLGIDKVYLTGYTPYPETSNDSRLPHLSQKTAQQIHKTALGAESSIPWEHCQDILECLTRLEAGGFKITALEQTKTAITLDEYKSRHDLALVVGNEVTGLDKLVLEKAGQHIKIPMRGRKESFNVVIAAAIALYHLKSLG